MIRLAMSSSAVFAVFPIQDVLRLDGSHRMNIPSTSSSNWQFRFELSQLNEDDANGLRYLSELFNRIPEVQEVTEQTTEQNNVSEKIEQETVVSDKKEKNIKRPKRRR